MKKIYALAVVALLIAFLPGCQKLQDYVEDHPDGDIKDCPVMQIIQSVYKDEKDTIVFAYNSYGDPISMTHHPITPTGFPNHIFRYDKKHRLSGYDRCVQP